MKSFDGFQLHNDAPFDEQIQFEPAADTPLLVLDWDAALAFDAQLAALKFDDHAFAVHRLQQSWPEVSVHLDGATDDSFGQCFDFHNGAIHVGFVRHKTRHTDAGKLPACALPPWHDLPHSPPERVEKINS